MSASRLPSVTGTAGFLVFASVILYPFPEARLAVAGLEIPYATVLLGALLVVSVARILLGRVKTEIPRRIVTGTWMLVLGLTLSTLVATLAGRDIDLAAVIESGIFVTIPCLFLTTMLRSRDLMFCALGLFAGVVYLTAYGLYRYVTEGHDWVEFHYEEATRNGDALFLVAAFCMSLALFVHGYRQGWPTLKIAPTAAFVAASGIAVALSFARGAWIGAALGAVFLVRKSRGARGGRKERSLSTAPAAAAVLLVGAALFMLPRLVGPENPEALGNRLRSITDSSVKGASNRERAKLVSATVAGIPRWGWTGTGVGNFALAIERDRLRLEHGHNAFSTIWIELGIVALIGLCLLVREVSSGLFGDDGADVWRNAVSAVLLAWLVNGLFETPTQSVFFWSLLGLVLAMHASRKAARPSPEAVL